MRTVSQAAGSVWAALDNMTITFEVAFTSSILNIEKQPSTLAMQLCRFEVVGVEVVKQTAPHATFLVRGLGRIFDVSSSSSENASPLASSPVYYDGIESEAFFTSDTSGSGGVSGGGSLKLTKGPECVDVVEVESLASATAMEAILTAEGGRGAAHWLVVYVRGSTTAVLFPPRETRGHSLARSGLTVCMEWLEAVGLSQVVIAVPSGEGETLCKNLLFLGFAPPEGGGGQTATPLVCQIQPPCDRLH
ncbi:hypothetical protein TcWFU_008359 [Taenia crassiceps]|uniref:Ornithine decarboxylase antizyme n=1 Tax=Taenia crassiceps TaxID=6207 RepID=A0ABR4QTD7_9CEST